MPRTTSEDAQMLGAHPNVVPPESDRTRIGVSARYRGADMRSLRRALSILLVVGAMGATASGCQSLVVDGSTDADSSSSSSASASLAGAGLNTYLIHQYMLSKNIEKYGEARCEGCATNLWPHSLPDIKWALGMLKDSSAGKAFRDGINYSQFAPNDLRQTGAKVQAEYVGYAVEVLKLYQEMDAKVILTFGLPLSPWIVQDQSTPPRALATGWCSQPESDEDWTTVRDNMNLAAAAVTSAIYEAADASLKTWMESNLVLEPLNEFDMTTTFGWVENSQTNQRNLGCKPMLSAETTGKRAAQFVQELTARLRERGTPIDIIMPSGVAGNPVYYKTYYENGGTGPANVHVYPPYDSTTAAMDSMTAVNTYVGRLKDLLRAINDTVPSPYKNKLVLGEFGLWGYEPDQCYANGYVLSGEARARFLSTVYSDSELSEYAPMRMKWGFFDGGTPGVRDERTDKSEKGDNCRAIGVFSKDAQANVELYQLRHDVDGLAWSDLPQARFKEYSGNDAALQHEVGAASGTAWQAARGTSGYLAFGPYQTVTESATQVIFDIVATEVPQGTEDLLYVDVYDSSQNELLGARMFGLDELAADQLSELALPLELKGRGSSLLEFRVVTNGRAAIRLDRIRVLYPASIPKAPAAGTPPDATAACTLPWGGSIPSGQSVQAYRPGYSCQPIQRTCTNGTLSGSSDYSAQTCTLRNCTLPWGGTLADGSSITVYAQASVPYGSKCDDQAGSLSCHDGTLTRPAGTYVAECRIENPSSCRGPNGPAECIEYTGNDSRLYHRIGRAAGTSWDVQASDGYGHVIYGPYVDNLPQGFTGVMFNIAVDNNSADDANIAVFEVYDATADETIGQLLVTRRQAAAPYTGKSFFVPASIVGRQGHALEFRVTAFGHSFIRVHKISVPYAFHTLPHVPG